ncbi:MAG: cation-translocating P-type ATPase [Firmicutes bacterium]|nr:cation-translocating P-type ATPase [Bacillota bacterium]
MSDTPEWYRLAPAEAAAKLGTSLEGGLSTAEARRRLVRFGPNELQERRPPSPLAILLDQFKDFMVLVLVGATIVSFFLGEVADSIAILIIVALNAILGFVQEYRAEQSLEALKQLTAPAARVVRDGHPTQVPARDVVPGDVLLLEAGDRVPADVRLVEAVHLEADEAALTGESIPVRKRVDADDRPGLPPGDQRGMAFQGTVVTRGRGRGVVVATGMHTEVGRIAGMIQAAGQPETPLQRRLEQLGKILVLACLLVSGLVVAGGVWQGRDPYTMFFTGVSLAVAAIPEGLPAIVTIALALGVQRMIRVNAIVRRLPAVETLGCATVICSDKTGTLTTNAMTVRALYADGRWVEVTGRGYRPEGELLVEGKAIRPAPRSALGLALVCGALCNNASLEEARRGRERTWEVRGDPTEAALLVAAAKAGLSPSRLGELHPRLAEVPFESERRRMSVVVRGEEGAVVFVKGAPDDVLDLCTHVRMGERLLPMDAHLRRELRAVHEEMAGRAMRVLGLAMRSWSGAVREDLRAEEVERDLVFLGFAGMIDPPRAEVRDAIAECHRAGLRAVMITGDHARTAEAIARELHMLPPGGRVLTGAQLDAMDDAELAAAVADTYVFARVSPAHKLRIVRAFQARGEVVAMTGDGVNDAPAVKEADIGVAMGRSGTDVTKEASDMILTDDNFATIVAAIREGRAIYDNIRKFIRYLLSCNTGEILLMVLATLLETPLPLLPIQMLLVNLVTDGLPALALGVDPPDRDVMCRRPRDPREGVFARGLARLIAVRGVIIGVASLYVFLLALSVTGHVDLARTMAMATLCVSQLFHSFDARSEYKSLWQVGIFTNPALIAAALVSFAALCAVIYLPVLQPAFHSVPLGWGEWVIVGGTSLAGALLAGCYNLARAIWHRRAVVLRQRG